MSKNKIMSLEDIRKQREEIEAENKRQLDALTEQENALKKEHETKVRTVLVSFPKQLAKVLGRDVNIAEAISLLKREEKELPLFGGMTKTEGGGDRSNRLTEEKRTEIRARMLKREVNKALGNPAGQVSVICAEFGLTAAGASNYKPTDEQVKAEVAKIKGEASAVPAPQA